MLRSSRLVILACLLALASCGDNRFATYPHGDFGLAADSLPLCLPDSDGVVERKEVTFVSGVSADVLVNPPGTVASFDPRGKTVEGATEWDLSSLDGVVASLHVESMKGMWFADEFPTATFAMGSTVQADTLQVLEVQGDRVLILGFASRQPKQTLLVYSQPVLAMRFPMRVGDNFSSTSELRQGSYFNKMDYFAKDTYQVQINHEGTLRLPHLRLRNVLLIETTVTIRTVGGVTRTTRQLQWFGECYGEVGRALSQTDEKDALFNKAIELRRLAL